MAEALLEHEVLDAPQLKQLIAGRAARGEGPPRPACAPARGPGGGERIGLEAISRGAVHATFIEQHFPTADLIRRNARGLGVDEERIEIVPGNTFLWGAAARSLGPRPWLVVASPPFEFYVSRQQEMLALLSGMIAAAPPGSTFVV